MLIYNETSQFKRSTALFIVTQYQASPLDGSLNSFYGPAADWSARCFMVHQTTHHYHHVTYTSCIRFSSALSGPEFVIPRPITDRRTALEKISIKKCHSHIFYNQHQNCIVINIFVQLANKKVSKSKKKKVTTRIVSCFCPFCSRHWRSRGCEGHS